MRWLDSRDLALLPSPEGLQGPEPIPIQEPDDDDYVPDDDEEDWEDDDEDG